MKKKILIVDDSRFFREQMHRTLAAAGYDTITAHNGERALELVRAEKPDLVLLDVEMPDLSGFDVCRILRSSDSNNLMPVIMITAKDDLDDKLIGLELGADDYITKPFNERELLSRLRNTLLRIDRNRSANPLTGLPGNLEIQREVESRIAKGLPFAVVYLDLDNFKSFNDVYGFAQGDLALKMTADIMAEQVRLFGNIDDFAGHIGGDDFVIITSPDKAETLCREYIFHFDERIRSLFHKEDLARGFISTTNRKGEIETFPITSVSLAIVTNERRRFSSHLEVSAIASELKKKLKSMPGSQYMRDRRSDKAQAKGPAFPVG